MTADLQDRHVRPRRSIFSVLITSIVIAGSSFTSPANAVDSVPTEDTWQSAAEVASATPAELRTEVADGSLKLVVVRDVNGSPVIETALLKSKADLEKTLAELKSDPSVVSVEPESQVRAFSNPPYFTSQWGLTTVASESVSATTQGVGIVVAVIDSGVDASHPDLSGRVIDGVDYRDGFSYLDPTTNLIDSCVSYTIAEYSNKPTHADFGKYDPNGHGTHVAGIISSNGIGIKSVAPQSMIMPVRVLSNRGSGDISDVACGIIYAANNGAHVINMSLGSDQDSPAIRAAVAYAITKDVLVVAATGNDGTTGVPIYPAALPDVIAVGAISSDYGQPIASFSNRGNYVDVVAPGVDIWSTCSATPFTWNVIILGVNVTKSNPCSTTDGDSNYESLNGTSMATPFVAGLAALILSMDQNLQFSDVASIVTSSAIDKGATGLDPIYGYGLVNAPAAIQKAQQTSQVIAAAAEAARVEAARAAAAAAAPAAAPAAPALDPVAVAPVAAEVIGISSVVQRKFTLTVDSPAGSKTWIQRKSGKKWVTLKKVNSTSRSVIKVSKSGTYRIQIVGPSRKVISSPFKVK